MIPLRLRIHIDGALPPFVVRLNSDWMPDASGEDAFLIQADEQALTFTTTHGELTIHGISAEACAGDVVLVIPGRHVAHRLIRANSMHNTLVATEQCDQLCVMCSQPPKKHHSDWFSYFKAACVLAPPNATIGISGGEPTLYKAALFDLFKTVTAQRPDITFHVLSNGQHFDEDDSASLRQFAEHVRWGIPLYSHRAEAHDAIVAKGGAFDRLLQSFNVLLKNGAAVELRTVVLRQNVSDLPTLAQFVAANLPFVTQWSIMQLERIGFAKKEWGRLFFDNSIDFDAIAEAVNRATLYGLNPLLYNFPLCTVPAPYRAFAPASISDWKQRFLPMCNGCALKSNCAGFFEWYDIHHGYKRIGLR